MQSHRGGGTCPFAEKTGTQEPIGAGKRAKIELRRLAFPAGDYELALKLADGTTGAVKLKVAVAKVSPDKIKSAPKPDLNKGGGGAGPQTRPRIRVP